MKKTLVSLLLVAAMLFCVLAPVSAEESLYPEKITIFTTISDHVSKLGVASYSELPVWQELEKRTGTTLEFIHPAAGADVMAQVNLMVASHELPDILTGIDWKKVSGGASVWEEDGVILDLTALIPEYMPNYWARINAIPMSIPTLSIDGKMYYINEIQHGVMFNGPNIRGDWLKNAGLEVPTTIDELHDVLIYFRDHDMNGNGDTTDEWPMSGMGQGDAWSPLNLMWAYGVHQGFEVVDGKVTHGMLLDEFTEAIGTVHQFYEEGLIDPDYASQDRNTIDGKYMNDMVGFEFAIQPTKMNKALNPDCEDGKFAAVGVPNLRLTADSPAYSFDINYVSLFTGACAAITGACKEPEKVLSWMDYMYSDEGIMLFNYGIEGLSFVYDEEGNPVSDMTGAIAANPNTAEVDLPYMYAISGTSAFPYANSTVKFKSTMHPFSRAAAEGWMADYDVSRLLPSISLTAEETEAINDELVDIQTYVSIQLDKLVNGQASLDEIPAMQEKLNSMGIQHVLEVYQAAYDRFNGVD